MREKLKKLVQCIANPRFLLCFGIAWIMTNGWSYIVLGLGTWFNSKWMIAIASGYLAFLWLPVTPEKIITTAIAMALLRWLFPNDKKTLGVLKELSAKAKNQLKKKRTRKKKN